LLLLLLLAWHCPHLALHPHLLLLLARLSCFDPC